MYKTSNGMRVLMISTDGNIGKPGEAAASRMQAYGTLTQSLDIILFSKTNMHRVALDERVSVYSTRSWHRLFYVIDAVFLGMRLAKRADLITTQDPFETGIVGVILALFFRKPLQVQVHTDFKSAYFLKGSRLNVVRRFVAPLVLLRANGIRVVLSRIKKSLEPLRLRAPISVLPIYVDRRTFMASTHSNFLRDTYPKFRTFILMISRLEREKNVGLGIDAFSKVAKEYPDTALVIVGSGSEGEMLVQKVAHLGLAGRVLFAGWQSDVSRYLLSADMYLHTAWYEGYGMSLIEASLAECAIVTTDVGIAGSLLITNENSYIAKPGDLPTLVTGIRKLLADPPMRAVFKKRAKEAVLQSLPSDFDSYLALYKKGFEEAIASK